MTAREAGYITDDLWLLTIAASTKVEQEKISPHAQAKVAYYFSRMHQEA
jgi:hypothetical protein